MKIAIPTMGDGGREAKRSAHFGHAESFTIVDVEDGIVASVDAVANPPHAHGGCMMAVASVAQTGADAVVVAGMGMRPMTGFAEAGIAVYFDNETQDVVEAAKRAAAGKLPAMSAENACQH